MRSLKKRGPHVLDDLMTSYFSLHKSVTSWRGRKSVVSVVLCRVVSQSPLQQLIANGETCVMDFGRNRFSSIGLPRVQVSWRNSCSVFRSSFGFSKWSRFRHEMVHLRMVTWQKAYNIIFNESFTLVNWHRIDYSCSTKQSLGLSANRILRTFC